MSKMKELQRTLEQRDAARGDEQAVEMHLSTWRQLADLLDMNREMTPATLVECVGAYHRKLLEDLARSATANAELAGALAAGVIPGATIDVVELKSFTTRSPPSSSSPATAPPGLRPAEAGMMYRRPAGAGPDSSAHGQPGHGRPSSAGQRSNVSTSERVLSLSATAPFGRAGTWR